MALGIALGAVPWVSATAAEPTDEPSPLGSAEPSSLPSSSPDSFSASEPLSDLPCATSYGVYEYLPSPGSWESPPSWASVPDSPVCVVLDAGSLRVPEETPTVTVTAEPSTSPELSSLSEQVAQLNETATTASDELIAVRALLLLSGGLLIFLLAGLFMRARRA